MENHTRRIRKARRQGLAPGKEGRAAGRSRGVSGTPTRGADLPGEPRPNARKKQTATTRKTKRAARSTTTRKRVARAG